MVPCVWGVIKRGKQFEIGQLGIPLEEGKCAGSSTAANDELNTRDVGLEVFSATGVMLRM